jgi:hypothetical protein
MGQQSQVDGRATESAKVPPRRGTRDLRIIQRAGVPNRRAAMQDDPVINTFGTEEVLVTGQ